MANKEEKNENKKRIFKKVGLVFRSPVRVDIMRELSESVQRPIDIADKVGIQKQNINYHLEALKKGGLVQRNIEEIPEEDLPKTKKIRINGRSESGNYQVSYGVELTKNGKNIVNQFIDPLYEEIEQEDRGEKEKKIKKEKEE